MKLVLIMQFIVKILGKKNEIIIQKTKIFIMISKIYKKQISFIFFF
jgi:hypothetical protein